MYENNNRILMYVKSSRDNTIMISEVTTEGIVKNNMNTKFDITIGCAGKAFITKAPAFEPSVKNSVIVSKDECNEKIVGTTVQSLIAVPIFNEHGDSIGVFEIINCNKEVFTNINSMLYCQKVITV